MKKKTILVQFFILFYSNLLMFAQSKEGYWDNVRATNETIVLKAGEKKIIKTADFPEGTTEIVYRITLLDENQKISSSLISVLKAIPDPTGISQGTAGVVFLASTISGEDKTKYAIFSDAKAASDFLKSDQPINACLHQDNPINKEARLLKTKELTCMLNFQNLFFVFESTNWVMSEKIVLEVVPWINYKASNGWNNTAKKEIVEQVLNTELIKSLTKKDEFLALFIENIAKKFKASEFNSLLSFEKNRIINQAIEESLQQTGEINKYFETIRNKSVALFNNGSFDEAIQLMSTDIFNKNCASESDYILLGNFFLLTKQFSKAEEVYNIGTKRYPKAINIKMKLAHCYMFSNRLNLAKEIHKQNFNQNIETNKSWKEQVDIDFKEFQKFGLPSDNFKKISRLFE